MGDVTSFVVPRPNSTPAFRGAVFRRHHRSQTRPRQLCSKPKPISSVSIGHAAGRDDGLDRARSQQPIAAVITNANAGLRWLGAKPPDLEEARQALSRIVRDGSRAGESSTAPRALVKKVPPRRELLDINEAICEVSATDPDRYAAQLASGCRRRFAVDLPLVPADRVQLQQVIMNLIVNAVEAMSSVRDRSRELTIASGKDDANAVFVEVQDTGPGIDPVDLDRLFPVLLHDQARWDWHGPRDQPLDRRGAWRAGYRQHRSSLTAQVLLLHAAGR